MPLISPQVPRALGEMTGSREMLPRLCVSLLDCGVLQELDWRGDLESSLEAGLKRWVNVECGAAAMRNLALSITLTDNLEGTHGWGDQWRTRHHLPMPVVNYEKKAKPQPDQDIPAFILFVERFRWFMVGRRVHQLERLQMGCGHHMMGLVDRALQTTIGGATPSCALDEIESSDWYDQRAMDEEAELDADLSKRERREILSDLLTPQNFTSRLPQIALGSHYTPTYFRDALRALEQKRRLTRNQLRQRETLETALELNAALGECDETPHVWDHAPEFSNFGDYWRVQPCAIRWGHGDWVGRVVDDFHENVAQSGDNEAMWVQAWHHTKSEGDGSAAQAVARTRQLLKVLCRLDHLIGLLHFEEPERPAAPQRLIDILGPGEDDEEDLDENGEAYL